MLITIWSPRQSFVNTNSVKKVKCIHQSICYEIRFYICYHINIIVLSCRIWRNIMLEGSSISYRALWDQRHEGATRTRQCTRRVTPNALTCRYWVTSECLWSARYIMLKSYCDINNLISIHYSAEICERSSEVGGGEPWIVENLCMVSRVTCIATPLWRQNYFGVTKLTQIWTQIYVKRIVLKSLFDKWYVESLQCNNW